MPTYHRPWLYPKQEEALFAPERYAVVEASTKAGKSVGCMAWITEQSFISPYRNLWWVAPILDQSRIMFRRMQRALPADMYTANRSEMTLTFRNGSTIFFKGADHPDSLYGEDVHAAVIDEASRVKEESWLAVRSTLTATRGPVRIIGNVRGKKNWAYKLGALAKEGAPNFHYAKLTAWDAVEGGVLAREEVEDAQRILPPDAFAELYLAEPTDDGSNPFDIRAIEECTVDVDLWLPDREYCRGPAKAYGWDLARGKNPGSDFTVGIGLNETRDVCAFDRFQGPWAQQLLRIRSQTGLTGALLDSTGVGDPIVEELQSRSGNFEGYKFTSFSKQVLMEGLAMIIQQRRIKIPRGPIVDELMEFEYQYTKTGVRYSAPEGLHDDCVMSLGLANHHYGDGFGPGVRFL